MKPERSNFYPNGAPIPESLPESYQPASNEDIPIGQTCYNCKAFDFTTRYCSAWKAPVKPKWWCAGWSAAYKPLPLTGYKHKVSEKEEWVYTVDVIRIDVPTMIRLLEYAKDEAKTDEKLHEIASELAEYSKKDLMTMKYYYDIISADEPYSLMTEESLNFRMDSRTLWSRFSWSLLNYSIALNSEISGVEQSEARIYSHADKIGRFIEPYYGEENARLVSAGLKSFGQIGVQVMQDLKAGIALNGTMEKWKETNEAIATEFSTINPDHWPKEAVYMYLENMVKYWVESIKARNLKDWVSNDIAIDNLDRLVTTGNGEMKSLADVFAIGIISQFPDKFVD